MSKKKKQTLFECVDNLEEASMDDTFAFIAGYTPAGFPYGTTWEEIGIDPTLPFEEKKDLYLSGSYTPPVLDSGLTPARMSDLKSILSTLEDVHTTLSNIGMESGIDDILDAADWVENAMVGIGPCISAGYKGGGGENGNINYAVDNESLQNDEVVEVDEEELPF